VTSTSASRVDEGGGATDEGVVTSGGDDQEGLTTLDSRGSIALVALVLVDSERLTRDGRLVDLEEGIVGNDATIGGDDGTLLNLQDIAGDDLGSLNLLQGTVTENNSLESKSPASNWSVIHVVNWAAKVSAYFLSSSTMEPAWYSWTKPTTALRSSRPQMTPKSTQSSRPAATMNPIVSNLVLYTSQLVASSMALSRMRRGVCLPQCNGTAAFGGET
jgi:hypothetical protein